jgi:hypothetical protein
MKTTKTTRRIQVRVNGRHSFNPTVTIRGVGFEFSVHIDAHDWGKPLAYELNGRECGKQVRPNDPRYGAIMRTALGAYHYIDLSK